MNYIKRNDSVCIIGTGKSGEEINPQDKDIWIMAKGYFKCNLKFIPDLLIEIHKEELFNREIAYYNELLLTKIPILCQSDRFGFQNPIIYPIHTIIKRFNSRYFSTTIAYAIAYAIFLEYENIYIHECNMNHFTDWILKGSIEYWLRAAEERKIGVYIGSNSDLLKLPKLYAYEASNEFSVELLKYRQELIGNIYDSHDINFIKETVKVLETNRKQFTEEIINRYGLKYRDKLKEDD